MRFYCMKNDFLWNCRHPPAILPVADRRGAGSLYGCQKWGAVIISENIDGLTIFFCAENIGVMTADAAVGQTDIVGLFASDGHGVAVDLKNFTTHFFVKNCESCIVCHNFSTYLKLQTQWVNKL